MKNLFIATICCRLFVACENSKKLCSFQTPKWGDSLGTVGFATSETWKIGNQEWSDAVTATACNKTTFDGGEKTNFNADCRSNPNQKGDLFSWCAVYRFQDQLCPAPWRVPTKKDIIELDIALGGTGKRQEDNVGKFLHKMTEQDHAELRNAINTTFAGEPQKYDAVKIIYNHIDDLHPLITNLHPLDLTQVNKYINTWGGEFTGNTWQKNSLIDQGSVAGYWSQSLYNKFHSSLLWFTSTGTIDPGFLNHKFIGYALRCVRDN
jgi:uncharacterized protein (TIGR02145 family)